MANMGKQQVSSRQVPYIGRKKSIFESSKFPQPSHNLPATSATTDLSDYRQPQPGEIIANVMGSLATSKSSSPPDYMVGKQLQAPRIQDCVGNNSTEKHLKAPPILSLPTGGVVQTKLTIGKPNDKYEQEADRVAARVVQQITRPTQVSQAPGEKAIECQCMAESGRRHRPTQMARVAKGGSEASAEMSSMLKEQGEEEDH